MDTLALEATGGKRQNSGAVATPVLAPGPVKRKPAKKAKKAVVFFEVEILDAKTKEKLCFLDKVRNYFLFCDFFFFVNPAVFTKCVLCCFTSLANIYFACITGAAGAIRCYCLGLNVIHPHKCRSFGL